MVKSGFKKNLIPSQAPGRVQDLIKSTDKMTYVNNAKKYEAFPELLTPLIIVSRTKSQAIAKHPVNAKSGYPIPSSMFEIDLRTSTLLVEIQLIFYHN